MNCPRGLLRITVAVLFLGGAAAPWARHACAQGGEPPVLLIPVHPDSASDTSAAAPLLVPGRPSPGDTALKSAAERAREFYRRGLALEATQLTAAATTAYRNAVKLDPTLRDANYRLGLLLLQAGAVEEALRAFAAEVAKHPDHTDAARELGLAYTRLGAYDRAVEQLELLTRRRPRDAAAWQALGFAYGAANRGADAIAALQQAVRFAPRSATAHRDLGVALAASGRTQEAESEYRRAAELDPHDAGAWVNLGNLERRGGQRARALDDYREAEKRDSSLALALQGQVQVLQELKLNLEAGEVYRRWLRAHPEDAGARLEAARLFDGLGRKDVALELARDGVRFDRRNGEAHLLLGMALQATGETRAALAEIRRAEQLFLTRDGKERARQLIAAMQADAPDSLRALFEADSVEHAGRER